MIRKSDFWIGVAGGMAGLFAYQWYRARKMAQGS